jgi:very-short-patch-repair endonuclease
VDDVTTVDGGQRSERCARHHLGVPPQLRRRHPAQVLKAMDGRATWQQLRRLSTQHAVRRALDQGLIVRARRGDYMLPELPRNDAVAARVGGVISHLSAAVDHGLAVLVRPDAVARHRAAHLLGARPAGATLHYTVLAPQDVRRARTTVLRTVLDCAATLPFAEGLAVADSALREGYLRPEDLAEAAQERRGPGARAVRRVARTADGDAANPFESALRAAVLDAGLTGFGPQQPVPIGGMTLHVDLGDPRRRIAVEADSFTHHGTRTALRDDCRRYDELVRSGWTVLRFAWEHVVLDPAWVGAVVRDTCERRGAA